MPSIFNASDNAAMIKRINQLSPTTPALWGKMTAAQMLAHSQVLIDLGLGKVTGKRGLPAILFGKMAKKSILSDKPIKKNLPTLPEAKISGSPDFELEKAKLIAAVTSLAQGGPEAMKGVHPFFGPLTGPEWDILHVKHLDHHLQQFGV